MKLTVRTADGGRLQIKDFDAQSALDLTEALTSGDQQFLTFDLDDGDTTLINRDQIVRVDIDG